MKVFFLFTVFISATFFLSPTAISDAKNNYQQLKETYRLLIRAIYEKDFDHILSIVHQDGVTDADTKLSKAEFASQLKDPNGYIQEGLYAPLLPFQKELCAKSGKAFISPYEFYKLYSDNFDITVTVLSEGKIFSVGAEGNKAKDLNKNCTYFLFPKMFKKEMDGKFYLIQNFYP